MIEKFLKEYNLKYKTKLDPLFTYIIHELKKPHDPKRAQEFLEITNRLDKIRGENIFNTIPELTVVKDMYPGIYKD